MVEVISAHDGIVVQNNSLNSMYLKFFIIVQKIFTKLIKSSLLVLNYKSKFSDVETSFSRVKHVKEVFRKLKSGRFGKFV